MNNCEFTALPNFASILLRDVSIGIALFESVSTEMIWCNKAFRKMLRLQALPHREGSATHSFAELFSIEGLAAAEKLFSIGLELGFAYDSDRRMRRGASEEFPAEIRLRRIVHEDKIYIAAEMIDLSMSALFNKLKETHFRLEKNMAELQEAQAEIRHNAQIGVLGDLGADLAARIVHPILLSKGIVESSLLPDLTNPDAIKNAEKLQEHFAGIERFATWLREFSSPRMTEVHVCNASFLVHSALAISRHQLSKANISLEFADAGSSCSIIATPAKVVGLILRVCSEVGTQLRGYARALIICFEECESGLQLLIKVQFDSTAQAFHQLRCDGVLSNLSQEVKSDGLLLKLFLGKKSDVPAFDDMTDLLSDSFFQLHSTQAESDRIPIVHRGTVLHVEDFVEIRNLIRHYLERHGWEVIEARDGQEALEILNGPAGAALRGHLKAIVSDVRMPRMSGPRLLMAAREQGIDVPFVFFSSSLVEEPKGEHASYENVFYLEKNHGFRPLLSALEAASLGSQGSNRNVAQ